MSEKQYKVSVASPFHNTNLDFFRKCMDSLRAQSNGFKNIQWVITVHNSEKEYVDAVKEIAEQHSNIEVYELYNDYRTASSPRNECLKHIRSKYVFFLDSDDFLFPEALEKLYTAMEENDAEVGSCREESIEGTEGLRYVDQLRLRFLLDQTKPLIVLHRNDHEMANYLDPRNLTVHKMYRMSLLSENNISFHDETVMGEDVVFNLNCAKYYKTVVVLPQYIGYGYFLNAGSLAQSSLAMNPEKLGSYMNDRLDWISMGVQTGLDVSNVAWSGLASVAKILSAPGLPDEFRKMWKVKFISYMYMLKPLRANQFSDEQRTQQIMGFARMIFAKEDNGSQVGKNSDLLWSILQKNAGTDIGCNRNFETIRTYEAYKSNVPLTEYDFYAPLIELTTRIGETDIFCGEPLIGYSLSSGTTSAQKRIPYTADHLVAYAACMSDILNDGEATFALLESLPKEMEYVDNTRLDSIIGAALSVIRMELSECSYAKRFKQGVLTSPIELFFPSETIDPRYARLLFALLDPDVSQIVAPFTWTVLDTLQFLEKNHKQLLKDIENGTISTDSGIPDTLREQLKSKLIASPERAKELRTEFEKGFEGIIPRIWKKCRRIVAAGTGAFAIYTRKLRFYSGEVIMNNGFYAASEAVIGRCLGDGSDEYALITDNAFFEFLRPGDQEPVDAGNIKEGSEYEIILTNLAGLYRYRLGDVIRVLRRENGVLIFTFEYRLDNCLKAGDVTITEKMLEKAVETFETQTRSDIRDFCAMIDEDGGLTVFVEPFGAGQQLPASARRGELMEEALFELCSGYRAARERGEIPMTKVRLLEPETHLLFRDRRMFLEKTAPDQIKPIRVLDTQRNKDFFMALSEE